MPIFSETLKFWTLYKNAGNTFSKCLLLEHSFENEYFLLVCESEKQVKNYLTITNYLKQKYFSATNFQDFVNIKYNNIWKYLVYKDVFSYDLDIIDKNIFTLSIWESHNPQEITKQLHSLWIAFCEYEAENSFRMQWDTLEYIDRIGNTVKISFWGDEIESIFIKWEKKQSYTFGKNIPFYELEASLKINTKLVDFFETIPMVLDEIDYYELSEYFLLNENRIIFSVLGRNAEAKNLWVEELKIKNIDDFHDLLKSGVKVDIFTKNTKTVTNFLELNNISGVQVHETNVNVLKSFSVSISPLTFSLSKKEKIKAIEKTTNSEPKTKHYVVCDDIVSNIFIKKRRKKSFGENFDLLLQIKPWDFIVHIDHGVWVFKEVIEKELAGIKREYITIEYKWEDKLFVPITEVGRVSKYVGSENPKLTSLSTKDWEKKLKKVQEDVAHIAEELLEIYAKRSMQKGFAFDPKEEETSEFLQSFEYVYTEDQIQSIQEIFSDMHSQQTMDRLVCGDVGFWKTEVAFASIFKALINDKQAVLISPLVVLAYEHFAKARERFASFPFNIEVLTRFESKKTTDAVLKRLKEGKVDFVIGTHRLLSEDVQYKDLGLLVIDEEHKFGVQAKEKIKKIRGNIDILSLSATPIPRSLNMALSGLKQVSILTTPPVWKQAIDTVVTDFSESVILDACKREFKRGGQVFFIHNRVQTIQAMQGFLEKLLPGKTVLVTHGQLPGDTLEKRIIQFKKKEYDILLSTTVIENGIDFRDVNTIFINDATNFGISQIHQLRGRVGRGQIKWYCYLLFRKDTIKEDAAKRLKTIVDYSHLGAGFELAIKDLEIRGGGDILGIRQSGSSSEVGLSLFLEMLENKVEELKNKNISTSTNTKTEENEEKIKVDTKIDIQVEAYIDNVFFNSELDKLQFYREIETISDREELENIYEGFLDISRDIPKATQNFFNLLRLKLYAATYKIEQIKQVGINYQIDFVADAGTKIVETFLKKDKEVKFQVTTLTRLRSPKKYFTSGEKFIQYCLNIFTGKQKTKVKIKRPHP